MEIPTVDEFLRYWERVRGRTRRVVACIPPERMDEAPAEGRFTPADLVRHLGATERWMWAENVRGRPSRYPGHGPELADGAEAVVAYLDRMHAEAVEIFRGLGPEDLTRKVPTPGGIELPCWKWLRAMVEHEIHHRGQLYQILGDLGVETPPLYGLTERQVFGASEAPEG